MGSGNSDEKRAKSYFQGEVGKSPLVNKLGISNQQELEEAEAYFVEFALIHGLSAKAKKLTPTGLKQMHKELFGEVYQWAGKYRDYTTGRGLPFCRPDYIDTSLKKLYEELHTALKPAISPQVFITVVARFIGELNAIHPFIDGNGRTQREVLLLIAEKANFMLNLTDSLNKNAWYHAAEQAHIYAKYDEFEAIIASLIKSTH